MEILIPCLIPGVGWRCPDGTCVGRWRAMPFAPALPWFWIKSFKKLSRSCGGRVTFSWFGQRESNPRERPPRLALSGHRATVPALPPLGHPCPRHARKVREGRPGFSAGLRQPLLRCSDSGIPAVACPVEKGSTSVSSPLRALSSDPHRRTGGPEERARSCAHSLEKRTASLRDAVCGGTAATHRVRARTGPPAFGVPCAAVSRRRSGREAGIGTMPMPFRRYRDMPPKSPAPAHGLAARGEGTDARVEATQERLPDGRQAPSGVSFSLGYSLLLQASCPSPFGPASLFACASCPCVDKQKRSNSRARGHETLLI